MSNLRCSLVIAALACGCATTPDDTSMSEEALSNPRATAFNYFVHKGLTKEQSAGIVGNLMQESSVDPKAVQYGGGPGRGIAQWSVGGRWDSGRGDSVKWYAAAHNVSMWALTTQLDFIWYELADLGGYGLANLRAATTVSAATIAFQDKYEICGTCDSSKRIQYAQQVLADFGGGGSGGGGGGGGAGCYSGTLAREVADNACVQSKYDQQWYQCSNGSWVDRWTDPDACSSVHPL